MSEAERWLGERGDQLTADEREYIGQGVALRERDRRAEEERVRAEQERRERDIRRRSVRKTLALVVALAVLGVLGTLGVSAVRRESIRHALVSDLGWVRISAPPGGEFMMGCVPDDKECFSNERAPDEDKDLVPRPSFPGTSRSCPTRSRSSGSGGSSTPSRRSSDACSCRRASIMEEQPDWSQDNHPVV